MSNVVVVVELVNKWNKREAENRIFRSRHRRRLVVARLTS